MKSIEKNANPASWVDEALAEAQRRQSTSLPKESLARIAEARKVWGKLLFPTPKLESWKYTNPENVARGPFHCAEPAKPGDTDTLMRAANIEGLGAANRLVFVDGLFSENLSSMNRRAGLVVERLREGAKAHLLGSLGVHNVEPFAALATALMSDCVCVSVAKNTRVEESIHIVHMTTAAAEEQVVTPRILVAAEEASEVTIIESHIGEHGVRYLSLPMAEIVAASGAVVDHYRIQNESRQAYHISNLTVEQGKDATVRTHVFSFGGALVRNNAEVRLKGSGAQAVLNGLSLLSGSQHVDNTTLIHHIEPSAESREHFKGVYADQSRGVFSGTITVEKVAQKTNAFQSNQALLLSPDASIETRPQLKIWADDVKCTHGATVGQLDSEAMFYLQSRGISREEARAFLIHAFASEVLTSVKVLAVREFVEATLSQKLEGSLSRT